MHSWRQYFPHRGSAFQCKENSHMQRLPPGIWTFRSVWLISARMGITANATLSRNATTRRDQRTHTDSPFRFSNRETGLEGCNDLRQGLRSRISKSPLVYFSAFTTHPRYLAEGKIYVFELASLAPVASLRAPNNLYFSWCGMVYRRVLGPSLSHLSLTEVAWGKVLYFYLWMNTFRLWALSNLARNHMSSN